MLVQHTVTLCTPLKLRTTSVPTTGKVFKVEDVNQDLLVELDGATVDEDPLDKTHYVLDQCSKNLPEMMENLPSDHSLLKIQSLEFQNETLYRDDHWVPTNIPHILRAPLQVSGFSRGKRGCSSGAGSLRGRRGHLSQNGRSSIRHVEVHRCIPGTSQEEVIEGTFLPAAGSEEQCVAKWLNKISRALQVFSQVTNRVTTRSTANPPRFWSSETSRYPVYDDLMPWKPDLILREQLPRRTSGPEREFSWKDVISFMELTSSSYSQSDSSNNIRKAILRKAFAVFASQPGRRFLFALSIANQQFRVHMFDRSGVVHSRPYNIH